MTIHEGRTWFQKWQAQAREAGKEADKIRAEKTAKKAIVKKAIEKAKSHGK